MLKKLLRSRAAPLLLLAPLSAISGAVLADPAATVAAQCAQCHALQAPDYEELGIEERFQRKAPALYFAGNKYRREWLVDWLQKPARIHPAGYFPETAVKVTADGDQPDSDALQEHLALPAEAAEEVADHLMTLTAHDDLIAADNYSPGSVSMRMGQMDFRKFKGCNACHQDEPGKGGYSGPVLHDAWKRLQPAYISSYLQDPTAWDPNTTMPVPPMNEAAVHKLVHYLRAIGGEQ